MCVHANCDKERQIAVIEPRTGDDLLEATKKGYGITMHILSGGDDRLVIELTPNEASELASVLSVAI